MLFHKMEYRSRIEASPFLVCVCRSDLDGTCPVPWQDPRVEAASEFAGNAHVSLRHHRDYIVLYQHWKQQGVIFK